MTAYQREKVQTIHTCGGPLWCVYICKSLCHKQAAEKAACSRVGGRLGGTELVHLVCQQGNERKKEKGEKKENSPSKKNT